MDYRQSGVNIDLANKLVSQLRQKLPQIGGFSGVYPLDKNLAAGKRRLLAATCDGVGTKLKVACLAKKYRGIGIDLVAMNVNDLLCCGALPLFFLDYFACGKLRAEIFKKVLQGILNGCREAGCQLLGGETAEMPGFYNTSEFDLAGFAVGILSEEDWIQGKEIMSGDYLMGMPSTGLHSNGFSLVRRVLSSEQLLENAGKLLSPTRIYVPLLRNIFHYLKRKTAKPLPKLIHGIAHITGGGFFDNIARLLPAGVQAEVETQSWRIPSIFRFMAKEGRISDKEMYRVFNMGIGMVLIVPPTVRNILMDYLPADLRVIGRIKTVTEKKSAPVALV